MATRDPIAVNVVDEKQADAAEVTIINGFSFITAGLNQKLDSKL